MTIANTHYTNKVRWDVDKLKSEVPSVRKLTELKRGRKKLSGKCLAGVVKTAFYVSS